MWCCCRINSCRGGILVKRDMVYTLSGDMVYIMSGDMVYTFLH